MRPLFSSLWIFGILLLIAVTGRADTPIQAPSLPANEWTVSSAPARFVVVPDQPDKSAPLMWVNLCLPNPNWAGTTMRVFTREGVAVGSDLLWAAPGEPTTVIFDSSSNSKYYYIYVGSNWPALHFDNAKAGVTLESRAGDGKTIDHLPDMQQAWNQSTAPIGRAIVQGLFEGGNRFGPQGNSLQHFQGWFNAANAEHLQLAAISTDASFVLVDGREVVEWPGRHDFHPGLGGQYQGAVDLAPGIHSLEYYNAYVSGNEGHPLLCCLAAKGGDLATWTMLTPDSTFFLPSARAHVTDYQLQTANATSSSDAPAYSIAWNSNAQSVIAPDVPDIGLISVQLSCLPSDDTAKWTFDDGSVATGANVQHLFPRPGMRTVQLDLTKGNQPLHFSQVINVHPNWTQLSTIQPQLMPSHQADIMGRDPATLSASDLAGCMAVFGAFKNSDGLLKMLSVVCVKMKDIPEADLPYIKDAAVYLAREDVTHSTGATQLLQSLVDRSAQDKPSAQLIAIGSASRLGLAELTLKTSDKTDDVRKLLDGIDLTKLNGDDHRACDTLRADLTLATGDVAGAKKQYEALTGDPAGPDARSSVRRIAKVNLARSYIDSHDYEAAERALAHVARLAPVEKLSPDWSLTRLHLYREENQPLAAYLWAKRLLPVLTDDGRSELLFQLTDLAFAQNDNDLAKKCLAELLKKHPYSPEAAQAKEKWPDKG